MGGFTLRFPFLGFALGGFGGVFLPAGLLILGTGFLAATPGFFLDASLCASITAEARAAWMTQVVTRSLLRTCVAGLNSEDVLWG